MHNFYANPFAPIIVLLALFIMGTVAVAADSSNKWRIEVDGGANSDGEMVFHVTPENGETIVVRVTVKEGTGENRVAKTIRDAFEVQLPRDQYHIEVDDGEDVLVKKKRKGVNFALTLVSSTVKHTEIEIEKE